MRALLAEPAVRSDLMLQIRLGGILFTDSEDMFQYFSMVIIAPVIPITIAAEYAT